MHTKTAGIYITRQCNLKCDYCNVRNRKMDELNISEWIRAIAILDKLQIKDLTILGGEPTIKKGLVKIVNYIINKTSLNLSLVTNATADIRVIDELVAVGLKRFSASIDARARNSNVTDMKLKSDKAIQLFEYLKKRGVKTLRAYCVLSAMNADYILELLEMLNEKGIELYLLPYHWAKNSEFGWQTRSVFRNPDLEFNKESYSKLVKLSKELSEKKKNGYLLGNTFSYLNNIPQYVIDLNWHCGEQLSELRIDADGSLMCCHDFRGEEVQRFTIFDLENEEKLSAFQKTRQVEIKECIGCYWPSQYISSEKMSK